MIASIEINVQPKRRKKAVVFRIFEVANGKGFRLSTNYETKQSNSRIE